MEVANQRRQARPVAGSRLGRGRRGDRGRAGWAADGVLNVIGDLRTNDGQFPDLGDVRWSHIGQDRVEPHLAGGAGFWMERHDHVRLTARTRVAGMPGLPAGFSPPWPLGRAWWGARWVRRGRFARILRGLGEALFKGLHPDKERRQEQPNTRRSRLPVGERNTLRWCQQIVHSGSMRQIGGGVNWRWRPPERLQRLHHFVRSH
jgi:hypothetical protein